MKNKDFPADFDPHSSPSSIIARLSSHFQAIVADCINPLGLIIPEWRILATLVRDKSCSVNDIIAATRLPQSTISRGISNLLKKNLVTKTRREKDNRYAVLEVTAEGRAQCLSAYTRIAEQSQATLDELEARISDFDAKSWLASAKAINQILNIRKE